MTYHGRMDTIYGVWCRLGGGVTGTHEGWLKRNGAFATFGEAEARAEAARLNVAMNGPYASGTFHYEARPYVA